MIDRAARTDLAAALRRLVAGQMTTDEFESAVERAVFGSPDRGVRAVYEEAWRRYDDGAPGLDPSAGASVSRWVGFLESNFEYEWRELPPWLAAMLVVPNLLSLGLVGRLVWRFTARQGDEEAWPFIRRADAERCSVAILRGDD